MFDIGQKVVVINSRKSHSTYQQWAEVHNLNNFRKTDPEDDGTEYTVTCRGFHGLGDKILYGIQKDGVDYIINGEGLSKAPVYEWQWLYKTARGSYETTIFRKDDSFTKEIWWQSADYEIFHRIEESKREVKP